MVGASSRDEPGPIVDLVPVQPAEDRALFRAGFLAAAGDPAALAHVEAVITCESGWRNIYGPGGPNGYYSVAQFEPGSWESAGGGDPFDLDQTGGNVARWMVMVDPGSTSGWPLCWWTEG